MDKGLDGSFASFVNTSEADDLKNKALEVIFFNQASLSMLGVDKKTIE